jgi:hypothetical protein
MTWHDLCLGVDISDRANFPPLYLSNPTISLLGTHMEKIGFGCREETVHEIFAEICMLRRPNKSLNTGRSKPPRVQHGQTLGNATEHAPARALGHPRAHACAVPASGYKAHPRARTSSPLPPPRRAQLFRARPQLRWPPHDPPEPPEGNHRGQTLSRPPPLDPSPRIASPGGREACPSLSRGPAPPEWVREPAGARGPGNPLHHFSIPCAHGLYITQWSSSCTLIEPHRRGLARAGASDDLRRLRSWPKQLRPPPTPTRTPTWPPWPPRRLWPPHWNSTAAGKPRRHNFGRGYCFSQQGSRVRFRLSLGGFVQRQWLMQIVDRGLFCERKGGENPGTSTQICISFPFRIYFSFKYCRELNKWITWRIII